MTVPVDILSYALGLFSNMISILFYLIFLLRVMVADRIVGRPHLDPLAFVDLLFDHSL